MRRGALEDGAAAMRTGVVGGWREEGVRKDGAPEEVEGRALSFPLSHCLQQRRPDRYAPICASED